MSDFIEFGSQLGDMLRGLLRPDLLATGSGSSEPVGPASDQCWKYTLEHKDIKATDDPEFEAAPVECVYLQSAAVEDGKASFVFCCQKEANGKCKDCSSVITLKVKSKKVEIARKTVQQRCVKQP